MSKWAVHFENLLGASIALNINGPKRMESNKSEKSNILAPYYKQINPSLFHISMLNNFTFHLKSTQINTEIHKNKVW